uniref:Zinc finger PHD-type domain-containing protein n=1 Tax=Cacopsylla melanoneura TaxID=428564 RepID=A0A8D9AWX1_9HEMI
MSKCNVCKKSLPKDSEDGTEFATCASCGKSWHLPCVPIMPLSRTFWLSKGPAIQSRWECKICTDPDSGKGMQTRKTAAAKATSSDKTTEEEGIKELLSTQYKYFENMLDDKFNKFQNTLKTYAQQIQELTGIVKQVEKKNMELENRLLKQEEENKEMKKKMQEMEALVQKSQQRENGYKMEITGFKEKTEVDENEFMKKILEKAECTGNNGVEYKVSKIVKHGNEEKGGSQTIVVQFKNTESRNQVLEKIKNNKLYEKMGDVIKDKSTVLFFSEYLTPYNRKLFFEAKKIKVEKKYAYLWIKHGKILLKRNKNSRIETIITTADLGKL